MRTCIDRLRGRYEANQFTLRHGLFETLLARPFETFEGQFELTGSGPVDVTMQLVALPKRMTPRPSPPYSIGSQASLIKARSLRIHADNLSIESTRIRPVPGQGTLGVFAVALAGLSPVRRRTAAQALEA